MNRLNLNEQIFNVQVHLDISLVPLCVCTRWNVSMNKNAIRKALLVLLIWVLDAWCNDIFWTFLKMFLIISCASYLLLLVLCI